MIATDACHIFGRTSNAHLQFGSTTAPQELL